MLDRNDYITDVEKQLSGKDVYKHVSFREKIFCDLVESNNKFFRGLKLSYLLRGRNRLSDKKIKHFM